MQPNPAAEAYLARQRLHAFQLGRLLADPLIDLWIDPDRLDAFVRGELATADPFTARIVEAEADYLGRVYDAFEPLSAYRDGDQAAASTG